MADSRKSDIQRNLARHVARFKPPSTPVTPAEATEMEQALQDYRRSGRHLVGHFFMVFFTCSAICAVISGFLLLGVAAHALQGVFAGGRPGELLEVLVGVGTLGLYGAIAARITSKQQTAYAQYCELSRALRPVSRARLKGCAHLCELCPAARRVLRDVGGGVLRQCHYEAMENAYFTDQNFKDVGVFGVLMEILGPLLFAALFFSMGFYLASTVG